MSNNNPFDDSFEESAAPSRAVASNPFSSSETTNPFAAAAEDTTSYHDDQDEDPDDLATTDAPAESTWQYLGNLPYRRIPVYSNVSWEQQARGGEPTLASLPPAEPTSNKNAGFAKAFLTKSTKTKCVGCPNGGPIAVMTLPITKNTGVRRTDLRILTVSGQSLAQVEFPMPYLQTQNSAYTPADILTFGFTSRCILILVLVDSLCITLSVKSGEPILQPFHICQGNTDLKSAHVYEGGVAVLSSAMDATLVELFDSHDDDDVYMQTAHPASRRETTLFGSKNSNNGMYALVTPLPTAAYAATAFLQYCTIGVLPRSRTLNRHPELFLSTKDNSVVICNTTDGSCTDVDCRARISSPIVAMCFAPNGRFLACFTEASMLTVISTSFETKVLDFDTSEGSNSPPLQMQWCGEDSVVLHWKNLGVLMVGPYGDWLRFPYEGTDNLFLLPEIDCCRVITDTCVEVLQRVPPATANLLRIGSIETTAMLLDAADAHYSGAPTSDEAATRAILESGTLEEAIETCVDSATKEFGISTQKRLLRAASYGMHFSYKSSKMLIGGPVIGSDPDSGLLPSKTTYKFVSAARKLRILNALRNPDVGFLLTAAQFDAMTPTGVVARLIAMKRPALAAEISKYLGLSRSVQLYARAAKAAAFVERVSNLSDSEIAQRAIAIVNGDNEEASSSQNRGGYASVALAANKAGRPGAANLLLMMESSVADKVPALISTGAYADAIAVATTAR